MTLVSLLDFLSFFIFDSVLYNINYIIIIYICIGYVMPRVLYQVYNDRARGQGDYKPDIAQVGMT